MSVVKKFKRIILLVAATALVVGLISPVQAAPAERNYLLATASTGGTYYPGRGCAVDFDQGQVAADPENRHVGDQLRRFR